MTEMGVKRRIWLRMFLVLSLIALGMILTISGIVLYFAPSGRFYARTTMFLGLTKSQWTLIHDLSGFITVGIALSHLILNRRPLLIYLRLVFQR